MRDGISAQIIVNNKKEYSDLWQSLELRKYSFDLSSTNIVFEVDVEG